MGNVQDIVVAFVKFREGTMINKQLQQTVVTPTHERLFLCRCCGHKLTLKERHQKQKEGKVVCSQCGTLNYSHRYIVH